MAFYRTIWFKLLRIVLLVYAVLLFIGCCCPYALIFQPPRIPYQTGDGIVCITAPDDETIAIFYRPAAPGYPTILYCHGNAENLAFAREFLAPFAAKGYGVCSYDYRGYGLSSGRADEASCYRDAQTVYTWLTEQHQVAPEYVVLHGRSLGGAMAVYLAARNPVAGLVLESSFVSAYRVITRIPLLPFDKFNTTRSVPSITCPVLIVHGTADSIIAVWHGHTLFDLAREPKQAWWVEGAGHNDLMYVAGVEQYYARLDTFYRSLKP